MFLAPKPSVSSSRNRYERCLPVCTGWMQDGALFTMATTNTVWVQGLNLSCRCNNRGFKAGRWNVIGAVVLNEQGVLLMSVVVNSRWHLALWVEMGFVYLFSTTASSLYISLPAVYTWQKTPFSTWLLVLHYCTTRPILSSVSFTLFPISAYTAQSS